MDTHYSIWQCLTSLYVFTYETQKWTVFFFRHKQRVHLTRLFVLQQHNKVPWQTDQDNADEPVQSENHDWTRLHHDIREASQHPVHDLGERTRTWKCISKKPQTKKDSQTHPIEGFSLDEVSVVGLLKIIKTVRRQDCWAQGWRYSTKSHDGSHRWVRGFIVSSLPIHIFFLHFFSVFPQILCEVCLVVYHILYVKLKKKAIVST